MQLPLQRVSAFLSGRFEVSSASEAYVQALYADYSATRQLAPAESGILLVPPTNPYLPQDLATLVASRVNPSVPFRVFARPTVLGPRTAENYRELLQVTVGLRGAAFDGWRFDVDVQSGYNERTERQQGITRISKYQELLFAADGGQSICGGLNVFGKDRISAECAAYVATSAANEARTEQTIAEASLDGPLFDLPAGELQVAAGVFHKRDDITAIRMVMLMLSIIGVGVFVGVAWKQPGRRLIFVAPVSWMLNLALFYAARLIGWPNDVTCANLWSQVIHLQALIPLIGGLIIYEHR